MVVRELLITLGIQRDRASFERANRGLDQLIRAGKALGALFAGGLAARGFQKLIENASDAAEEANKFAAVFEGAADTTAATLEETAARTGAATDELQKFASSIGALAKPALGSASAAGKMAASVAELALDVASFNDLPTADALQKIRAGLIGSAEPLQSVGVDVRNTSEDIVKFAESLGKSVKELTRAELIQARYNAIVNQLRQQGALGDAAKTADGFANASRNLGSNLVQLSARIGQFFLPMAGRQVVSLRELTKRTMEWIKANRDLIQQRVDRVFEFINSVLATMGRALDFVAGGWRAIADLLGPVGEKLLVVGGAVAALAAILGLPVLLLLALGAALALVAEDFDKFRKGGDSAIGVIVGRFEKLREEFGNTIEAIAQLSGQFGFHMAKMLGASEETSIGIGKEFATMARIVGDIVDGLGTAIGAVVGGPIIALAELAEGNFAAAGRAISQMAGDIVAAGVKIADAGTAAENRGDRAGAAVSDFLMGTPERVALGTGRLGPSAPAAQPAQITSTATINIQGDTDQSREFGRGVGEGIAREETRRLRQGLAATVGGAIR